MVLVFSQKMREAGSEIGPAFFSQPCNRIYDPVAPLFLAGSQNFIIAQFPPFYPTNGNPTSWG